MATSTPVDGFALDYTDHGTPAADAPAVVLLHGWPGDAQDFRHVVPLLTERYRVIVPDLRGFGASDRQLGDPAQLYSASAQARSVVGLVTELGLTRPVLAGYDVGSRVAQTVAHEHPEVAAALAISPPLPGAGTRILDPDSVPEFWYQHFHRSPACVPLLDGRRDAVHAYLHYIWSHWSGPDLDLDTPEFERLIDAYARPGAFEASINWYRSGGGFVARSMAEQAPVPDERVTLPVRVLWPDLDPLFPRAWSDRVGEFYADVAVREIDGVGHFTPLEAPQAFAELVDTAVDAAR